MLIAYEGDTVTFSKHNQPLRTEEQLEQMKPDRKVHNYHFTTAWLCGEICSSDSHPLLE